MASGFQYNGTDFDSLFLAIGGSAKGPNCGYVVSNGQGIQGDISNRYKQNTGGMGLGYNTGYTNASGVDVGQLFVDINQVAPVITAGLAPSYTFSNGTSFYPSVSATGSNVTFSWYQLGALVAQHVFTGAGPTTDSFNYGNLVYGDDGTYSVTVSNTAGSASSTTSVSII